AHPGRVEPCRGLVEQEQARPAQQRSGDAEPLAHAVRVAPDAVARAIAQVDDLEHLVDPPGGAVAVERGQELEVRAPAQIRIEARRLAHRPRAAASAVAAVTEPSTTQSTPSRVKEIAVPSAVVSSRPAASPIATVGSRRSPIAAPWSCWARACDSITAMPPRPRP